MTLPLDLYAWQSSQVLCLVSKPDLVVIEVEVDRNAIGQDILDKVCASIGTVEKDYFGLQYYSQKREPLWLNLRNRIAGKFSGQSPFRLRLRVKYFIEPHYLLQDTTRNIFYLQLKQDFLERKLKVSPEVLPSVLALAAQVEYNDLPANDGNLNTFESYAALCPSDEKSQALSNRDLHRIMNEHAALRGSTKSTSISKFLAEVAKLPTYGTECYRIKLDTGLSTETTVIKTTAINRALLVDVILRIGPHGIEIFGEDNEELKKVPFQAIQLSTHAGKLIDIHVYQDDGSVKTMVFRAVSESCSNALYRIITEMLAFYTWDTVHSSVIHQHCLDFKGHFLALFRPNDHDLAGKNYVFDVQRTFREALDNARRILYRNHKKVMDVAASQTACDPAVEKTPTSQKLLEEEVEVLKDKLTMISDALTCRMCFDDEIRCAFMPCGHQVCCKACAKRCQTCPICRKHIENILVVFLPIEKDFIQNGGLAKDAVCVQFNQNISATTGTQYVASNPANGVSNYEAMHVGA